MKTLSKNVLASVTIFLFLGVTVSPMIASGSISDACDTEQELDLLHGETYFDVIALENVTSPFNLSYVAPLNYGNQAPILVEICSDSTANIISYSIPNDTNEPNKIINFTIGPMQKGDNRTIHFQYWVLVKNNEYADIPKYVKIPKEDELSEDVKTFLVSTKAIQSDNILIRLKARQVKRLSNNLIRLANRIVLSTSNLLHRPIIKRLPIIKTFYFRFHESIQNLANKIVGSEDWVKLQDALSVLFLRGNCNGVANLGAALFRANGVPARSIIITPTYPQRVEQHYMCEYYCPDYGWVPAETMLFSTPPKNFIDKFVSKKIGKTYGITNQACLYEPKTYIILRINYPEDENLAGGGLSYYGGHEPWWWWKQDDKIVCDPPYTYGRIEKELATDQQNANLAFNLTKDVYELHTHYIGMSLFGENLIHYEDAILAQKNAIECFKQSDMNGYTDNTTVAYNEYLGINYT